MKRKKNLKKLFRRLWVYFGPKIHPKWNYYYKIKSNLNIFKKMDSESNEECNEARNLVSATMKFLSLSQIDIFSIQKI